MTLRYANVTAGLLLAALTLPPAIAAPASSTVARDPNEKICETVSQIGSRLSKKKICATRAEWAEIRKRDREVTEEAQRSARVGCGVAPSTSHAPVPAC